MLTRHNTIAAAAASSSRIEAIPINLIATEDGRTLLAMTEDKDGVLEIVTAPITLIGQNGAATSLADVKALNGNFILHSPVFQINLQDVDVGSEPRYPLEHSATVYDTVQRNKSQLCSEVKCKKTDMSECLLPPGNVLSTREKEERNCKQKSKRNSPGRPRKSAVTSLQGTDNLRCDICHQEFVKQALYRRHMENHAEEKPHRCPKCSASFNVPTNFTLHMATHNTGEPKCPECGKKFARMASLKSHMLLHEKEENLFCTECEDAFSTKGQLDAHLKLHGEKWAVDEVRKCKLCSKQFAQPALYRLHIREHYRLQTKIAKETKRGTKHKTMYKCTICLKSFQKPSQLMRHIRVHTGEKPFKCTVCGRAFTQKSSLQIHTWQHNGIRPHACELCNAKFSQKGNLNAHVMRVHNVPEGEPIYGCNYCSCVFKKLGSLNGHMKRMHTDVNEESGGIDDKGQSANAVETDIRATVDSVITQLASLESEARETTKTENFESRVPLSGSVAKKDILQQALKNSGLPSKNKAAFEGTAETKRFETRTNFVTLLDRAPDGGTRKYLTIKQRCVGNVRWYACTFCHKEFKKPSDLIRHLRVHTQEKPFKCTYCYRSFALKSTMIAHERTHSNVRKYACNSCDKTFVCQSSLISHSKLHEKSENCSNECMNIDKSAADMYGTIDTVTCTSNQPKVQAKGRSKLSLEAESLVPQVVLQEPLLISEGGYKICVAQVPSREKRTYDTADPDPTRPHKCWTCQATFTKISHLKQHHRRHTGERPYKCTKCDRRFTSNSVLKSHLHTHEDSRPYSCSICNAKFSTQSSMKRHLVTHSNKRPFMCPYCHKTFKTYVNCRKHMKIHKYELAERQLEQQKIRMQEESSSKSSLKERCKEEKAVSVSVASDISDATTTTTTTTTPTALTTMSPSTFSDNLTLSRFGSVELSFQPQLGSEFSQAFAELQAIAAGKEEGRGRGRGRETEEAVVPSNCDAATFINENVSEMAVMNLEHSQMLHSDDTAPVALPVYSTDQTFIPESIRDIEETLNQQLFNIGMNLSLGSNHPRHSNSLNTIDISHLKEQQQQQQAQQPVLNVVYENNNVNSGTNNVEQDGGQIFSSQLDSFEMDHIGLQSDAEIDIGLDTNNSTSMASILPRSVKEEHRLSVCVTTTPNNANDKGTERSAMQAAVVFISQEDFPKAETAKNELTMGETGNDTGQQCTTNPILLTEELQQATSTELSVKIRSSTEEIVKNCTGHESSLLQCHMCSEQGFTAVGLKEHLTSHRGTKEYQCSECSSRFCTNGGLNRHSKIHAVKQSLRCPSCEKHFSSRTELRSHVKSHETAPMWNGGAKNSMLSLAVQPDRSSRRLCLSDIAIDQEDSSVSERVLLDTVAEKEVMNRIESTLAEKKERKEYTNKCKYCPKTFRKPSDLIRHVRTHTGERPYKCDYCSKSFAVKCTLDSHTKVHTGKKTFRCHVCSSLFATKGSLKVHMRLHTGSKPFRCPICDSRFRTSGHRKVHLLKHAREQKDNSKRRQKHWKIAAVAEVVANLGKCDEEKVNKTVHQMETDSREGTTEGEVSQQAATAIASHFEAYSIETAASCLSDQMNFDADGIISNNDRTIVSVNENNQLVTNLHFLLTNGGLITIQTEEEEGLSLGDVNSHRRPTVLAESDISGSQCTRENAHTEEVAAALETSSTGCRLTVASPTTQLEPLTKVAMGKTLPMVAGRAPIKGNASKKECDICGKAFTKPYQVERHKRIHTGERPYKCDLCAKSFAQKSTLQMHEKHHTGDRPYACSYCEYSFTQKGNLRTHVKRVHQLDTADIKKWKRTRQSAKPSSLEGNAQIETKSINLEDISFVELLK